MLKSLRVAGHPLHPALAHLPIGAWVAAAAWDVAALMTGDPGWWRMAYWTIAFGLAAAVLAAAAGFVDYLGLASGSPAEKTANYHLGAVLAAAAAYLGSLLARGGPEPLADGGRFWALALAALGLALLAIGGWLGGELVYRHGVGVNAGASADGGRT